MAAKAPTSKSKTTGFQLGFTREKETPGTIRFKENGDKDNLSVGTLYLKKAADSALGSPDEITVTIKAS